MTRCLHWWVVTPDEEHVFCKFEEAHDGHCEPDFDSATKATTEEVQLSNIKTRVHTIFAQEAMALAKHRMPDHPAFRPKGKI